MSPVYGESGGYLGLELAWRLAAVESPRASLMGRAYLYARGDFQHLDNSLERLPGLKALSFDLEIPSSLDLTDSEISSGVAGVQQQFKDLKNLLPKVIKRGVVSFRASS